MQLSPGVTLWLSPLHTRLALYTAMGQNLDWRSISVPWTIDGLRHALEVFPPAARFCQALADELQRRHPNASRARLLDLMFMPPAADEEAYLLWMGPAESLR